MGDAEEVSEGQEEEGHCNDEPKHMISLRKFRGGGCQDVVFKISNGALKKDCKLKLKARTSGHTLSFIYLSV